MRAMGLRGAVRGKTVKTTLQNPALSCPLDRVNREFHAPAPDRLWVSDFTYVATWQGFAHVAFVIDAYARRIVGWRVSRSATAGFVLDALEQAIHQRRPEKGAGLVAHSDRGSQYLAIRYTERLAEAGIAPSVGSTGRQLRQRAGRDRDRALQDRGDPPPRALARPRGGRVRHPRVGPLVQPPSAPRADRTRPARRGRGRLPRADGRHERSGITQTKSPPANPGRFTGSAACSLSSSWRPVMPGSASNHAFKSAVTASSGSGTVR